MSDLRTMTADTAKLVEERAAARKIADSAAPVSVRLAAAELAGTLTTLLHANLAQLNARSKAEPEGVQMSALFQKGRRQSE